MEVSEVSSAFPHRTKYLIAVQRTRRRVRPGHSVEPRGRLPTYSPMVMLLEQNKKDQRRQMKKKPQEKEAVAD